MGNNSTGSDAQAKSRHDLSAGPTVIDVCLCTTIIGGSLSILPGSSSSADPTNHLALYLVAAFATIFVLTFVAIRLVRQTPRLAGTAALYSSTLLVASPMIG